MSLEDRDAEELILVLCGYHKLLTERELDVIQDTAILQQQEEEQQQQGMHNLDVSEIMANPILIYPG